MVYNTNYQIFDSSTKQVLFSNLNNSCFAEFSAGDPKSKTLGFFKDRYMEIYHPLRLAKLKDESIFEYWVSILNRLGLKMTLEKRDYSKYKGTFPEHGIKEENWVWTLDFKDYTSKPQVKLALHMLRYSYEYDQFETILQFKEIADKYPDDDIFTIFQYCCLVPKRNHSEGHAVFYRGGNLKSISTEKLKEYYIKWENSNKPNNWEIDNISSENRMDGTWVSREKPSYEYYIKNSK